MVRRPTLLRWTCLLTISLSVGRWGVVVVVLPGVWGLRGLVQQCVGAGPRADLSLLVACPLKGAVRSSSCVGGPLVVTAWLRWLQHWSYVSSSSGVNHCEGDSSIGVVLSWAKLDFLLLYMLFLDLFRIVQRYNLFMLCGDLVRVTASVLSRVLAEGNLGRGMGRVADAEQARGPTEDQRTPRKVRA